MDLPHRSCAISEPEMGRLVGRLACAAMSQARKGV
jgi:hypothetical protein